MSKVRPRGQIRPRADVNCPTASLLWYIQTKSGESVKTGLPAMVSEFMDEIRRYEFILSECFAKFVQSLFKGAAKQTDTHRPVSLSPRPHMQYKLMYLLNLWNVKVRIGSMKQNNEELLLHGLVRQWDTGNPVVWCDLVRTSSCKRVQTGTHHK